SYDNVESAKLLFQHIMATQYNEARLCVVSGPSTLQKAVCSTININHTGRGFYADTYTSLKALPPDQLNRYDVMILLEDVTENVQYLNRLDYTGDIAVISGNQLVLSMLQDGKISAVIYRSPENFLQTIKSLGLSLLQDTAPPANTYCYQRLLNINNIHDYLKNNY
ncbi:MAG: hypothetical protein ACRC36_19365, partial [Lacrimispora sphenoides]